VRFALVQLASLSACPLDGAATPGLPELYVVGDDLPRLAGGVAVS